MILLALLLPRIDVEKHARHALGAIRLGEVVGRVRIVCGGEAACAGVELCGLEFGCGAGALGEEVGEARIDRWKAI